MRSDDHETEKLSGPSAEVLRTRLRATGGTCLMVQWRDGSVVVPLVAGVGVVIGRATPSEIIVPDTSLSRQHARFVGAPGGATVEDLGSTNGTTVAGKAVEQAELAHGDRAVLGAVSVTVLSASAVDARDIAPHDRFRVWVDEEIGRARFFRRSLSVFMLRFGEPPPAPEALLSRLRSFLRPVDRVGQYAANVIEVLAPEQSAKDVRDRLAAATRSDGGIVLRAGIAAFPESGASAEQLLGAAWDSLRRASPEEPLVLSDQGGSRPPSRPAPRPDWGTKSARMREVQATAERVARSAVPVLIQGETGTGKEVLARAVHDASPRREAPFVCVNCGAMPASLVESILFGHERGAFTGASQRTQGVFEAANGGTVFLDEIGELPLAVQAVLLRVLESKSFTRVGATKETVVDTRILAATHRDLELMVETGTFRQDLLYRLNAVTLQLPSLRDRREDIPDLAQELLAAAAQGAGALPAIEPEAMEALEGYSWPGNIRELRNVIDRALAIAESPAITVDDLPERMRGLRAPILSSQPTSNDSTVVDLSRLAGDYHANVEALEAEYLRFALSRDNWNQTHTARRLGMSLRTLVHKIKVLGVRKPTPPTTRKV